ncbi:MAG: FecR domain-containing protein [Parvularculaceae bacterium]
MNDQETINEEALAWSVRAMSGEMTVAERETLRAWLNADPRHAAAFEEHEDLSGMFDEVAFAAAAEEGAKELMRLSDRKRADAHPRETRRAPSWRASGARASRIAIDRRQAVAAGAALFVAGAGFLLATRTPVEPLSLATAIGEQQEVALEDGSQVSLNTNSRLSVVYTRRERQVTLLAGEAMFDVEKNPERPFIVDASAVRIEVTGTRFNVRRATGGATVSVIEGSVRVTPAGSSAVTLSPGQSLFVSANGAAEPVASFDAGSALAWTEGKARFRETPLREAIADLNRYYQKPITLARGVPVEAPLTGEFDVADQTSVVRALSAAFSLTATEETDRIVLRPVG